MVMYRTAASSRSPRRWVISTQTLAKMYPVPTGRSIEQAMTAELDYRADVAVAEGEGFSPVRTH